MASTINLLRLLADPTRLRLLLLLEQEELSVAELQQILGMGQSRISSHLAQLKRAGVVADRRVGKNVYYGANDNGQNAKRERVAEITRLLARELPEGSRDRTSSEACTASSVRTRRENISMNSLANSVELCAGAVVAGACAHADHVAPAVDRGRPGRRRRDTLATAGETRAQSYCHR